MSRPLVAVVLVDARGWVLLQERDEQAPVNPDEWSLVGGGVEQGESDLEAALRELAEETDVTGVELTHVDSYAYYCDDCATTTTSPCTWPSPVSPTPTSSATRGGRSCSSTRGPSAASGGAAASCTGSHA